MGRSIPTEILIVDDESATRSGLEKLLSAERFRARVAASGSLALELAATKAPDVIISDLKMPGMDGVQLLEELRARKVDAPVIFVTGLSDVGSAVVAMRAGASDYLTKPIDADALLFAIERAVRTRDLLRETAALRAHNEELAALAERNLLAREELLSIVAHDLRGPLATILLAARSDVEAGNGMGAARAFGVIQRAAQRMKSLIEDLLDVARIETGGLTLDLAPHPASALLYEVASTLELMAKESGVRVEAIVDDDFVLSCAFERIVQVLVNLASNALKVAERGSRVRLRAERRGDHAWFAVEDEGPGISPGELPYIFDRGWRSARTGRYSGAGLGLAIAKGIVEAHGGVLGVESTVDAGSIFHFEMPLRGSARTSWRMPTASIAPEA